MSEQLANETRRGDGGARSLPVTERLFRTGQVSALLGLSRRQLQYWAQTELIPPGAQTPGGHHRYTFADLIALGAAKQLIDAGVSVQRIRGSIRRIREMLPRFAASLGDLVFVATGDVVLVFREKNAFETIRGQEWVFHVSTLTRTLEGRVTRERDAKSRRVPTRRLDRGPVPTAPFVARLG